MEQETPRCAFCGHETAETMAKASRGIQATIQHYMRLPYTKILKRDAEGDVIATIAEFNGCTTHGSDEMEALTYLKEAQEAWLEASLLAGHDIPQPASEDDALSRRIERSLRIGKILGPEYNGTTYEEIATELVQVKLHLKSTLDSLEQARRKDLFQAGQIELHSGAKTNWKIECDALSDSEIDTLALMLSEILPAFGSVEGVPRGGDRLAKAMLRYCTTGPLLIVDDVLTTGNSMAAHRAFRKRTIGAVLFARGQCPPWVVPLFQLDVPADVTATGIISHWMAQGGELQFGPISGRNSDELIADILRVVRKKLFAY